MTAFEILYHKYIKDKTSYLDWNQIKFIDDKIVLDHDSLPNITKNPEQIKNLAKQVCIIKLNGGLGTSMGCIAPKSLLKVKDDYCFMDIIIKQCIDNNIKHDIKVPLLLMNSFYTHDLTQEYLQKRRIKRVIDSIEIQCFDQHAYPRILKSNNEPLPNTHKDHLYPPGHGDLFASLQETGLLKELLKRGIKYVFVSNSDNLGATMDFNILNDIIDSNIDFALELTDKTLKDVKGGTLIKYSNRYMMFEVAQCDPEKISEFTSIEKFKYFNTNNVWINLDSVEKLLNTDYIKDVDLIVNQKKLKDGRDCVQLEYAIGSMIKFFDHIKCYRVKRDRYIPVKTNQDLETVRSDKYLLDPHTWKLNLI